MDFWTRMIMAMLIAIIVPIIFSIFWFCKLRGEKKLQSEGVIRTRPPKILSGFFLGFALLVLLGGIAGIICCCITDSEHTSASMVIVISVCITAFSGIGFFGYAYVRFNYVIADDEGVISCRLFHKKIFYRYEEIGYFQNTISMGMMGGLKGYDKNNKKIFAVEAIHIGASALAQRLRDHKVVEMIQNLPILR